MFLLIFTYPIWKTIGCKNRSKR